MKIIIIIIAILFICNCKNAIGQKLNEEEAIKLAEDFIRCNGYTKMPIDTSNQKLSFTMNDQLMLSQFNKDSVIKHRYNSLYPLAKYILYESERKRWLVGFIFSDTMVYKLDKINLEAPFMGSTVIVDEETNEVRLSHLNPILRFFKKLF